MRICTLYLLVLSIIPANAQEFALNKLNSSERTMEWIDITSPDASVQSFIVYPESQSKVPSIIILHEEFGMTEWIMSFADQLASQDYLVVVPDLLTGKSSTMKDPVSYRNWGEARENLFNLEQEDILVSIDLVMNYLKGLPSYNETILIAGLGWGGSQVFHYLSYNGSADAGIVFYGAAPGKMKLLNRISSPIYGFYGEYDSKVNRTLWSTDKKMKKLGKSFHPVVYDFGGHGFMRSGERPNANEGNIKARTAAWKRLNQLLEEYNKTR